MEFGSMSGATSLEQLIKKMLASPDRKRTHKEQMPNQQDQQYERCEHKEHKEDNFDVLPGLLCAQGHPQGQEEAMRKMLTK